MATATVTVTLPASLAFLVSNFHSLVNIKLDGNNYLLWRVQVENVMTANGYFDYLEGNVECPPSHVTDSEGQTSVNPAFTLWTLIDTQLLSCLTASISQNTLPYVLGLRHVHDVWNSLAIRYNSLSHNHVQELKNRLYNISKTSTMEKYIDTIKEYAQKLAAAGSPLPEDDLVFHTLRGLPKVFNGFRTAIRTRGGTPVTLDELFDMLNHEEQQLSQESSTDNDIASVLVATHGNKHIQGDITGNAQTSALLNSTPVISPQSQFGFSMPSQFVPSQFGIPMNFGVPTGPSQFPVSTSQFVPQASSSFMPMHQFSQSSFTPQPFRPFPRGRGRGPKLPCDICGRQNHSTNYCYYRAQIHIPFDFSSLQWRGPTSSAAPIGIPMYRPNMPFNTMQPHRSSMPMVSPIASTPMVSPTAGTLSTQHAPSQQPFAGFTEAFAMPYMVPSSSSSGSANGLPGHGSASYGFTEPYVMPSMIPHSSGYPQGFYGTGQNQSFSVNHNSSSSYPSQPWYFDSGATHHVTNNLQHLSQSQPASMGNGVMVGNGSNLQVTHTGKGQEYQTGSVSGSMSQGSLSTSDLL